MIYHNAVRTAEVALGRLAKFFYAQSTQPLVHINYTTLAARIKLKAQCHDIDWYLTHIIPEMPVPPDAAVYYESVTHEKSALCLQRSQNLLTVAVCELLKPEQVFYLDTEGKLRQQPHYCFRPQDRSSQQLVRHGKQLVSVAECSDVQQKWMYDPSTHQLIYATLCLTVNDQMLVMADCKTVGRESHWKFRYYFDWTRPLHHVQ